jgi:CCR4-NOT transcription complex subunit 1
MRNVAKECKERRLSDLPALDHPIFQYIDGILQIVGIIPNASKVKDSVCTDVASHLCNIIYADDQGELEIESVVFLLRKLCEMSPNTAKEVVMWLARDKEDEVCH